MKKAWKIIKYLLYIIIGFLLLDLAVVVFFSVYRPPLQKAGAIVVLGAAINTPALYNRTLDGLKLYEQGYAPVMVLSGGVDYPKSIPEAVYMQNLIIAQWENQNPLPNPPPKGEGTKLPPMLLDENANSTYQNIVNSKALIPKDKSIIIVSDGFHLARAVLMAKREGFGPVYWSSPNPSYYSKGELAYYYAREVLAMIDYIPKFITGR
jgi:uncharacterized SAM-binding protein YcdF (DUF218 family)